MARPVNADAQATRRKILESALAQFSTRGPDAASIRDIAAGADVSLGMVRHYFGNKQQLFDACIDQMYEELMALGAEWHEAVTQSMSIGEAVEQAIRRGFQFSRKHQIAMRLLIRTIMGEGEFPASRRERHMIPLLMLAAEGLSGGKPASVDELRLTIQSATFLVARYAVASDRDLATIVGPTIKGKAAVLEAVEDHLVNLIMPHLIPD